MTQFNLLQAAFSLAFVAAIAPLSAQTPSPPPEPGGLQAGAWSADIRLSGVPGGDKKMLANWCFKEAVPAAQREQALLAEIAKSAAAKEGPGAPTCRVNNPQRSAEKSEWQSVCKGPRGDMNGSGSGEFKPTEAQLQQTLTAKMLGMSLKLQQQISAKRSGDC